MITLREFLFLENIDEIQSNSIINEFGDISFDNPNKFRDFFFTRGIQLKKNIVDDKTEKTLLLERFKSFKNSVEYINAKKYIERQIALKNKIKEIQKNGGNIEYVTNLLDGADEMPINPFFNFIVRKILTGSDNGVLPSEELRVILDKLIQEKSVIYYDEISDTVRNENSILVSYKNIYKNKGRVKVPVLDERFVLEDFRYIVDNSFVTLQPAVEAERNIVEKINAAVSTGDELADTFLTELGNLVSSDSNSVAGLSAKIKELENELQIKQSVIETRMLREIEHEQFIDSIATDNVQKEEQLKAKDEAINVLSEQLNTTLQEIKDDVDKQVGNVTDSLETLNETLKKNSDNSEQDKEISKLKDEISTLKDDIKDLLGQLNSLKNKSTSGTAGTSGNFSRTNLTTGSNRNQNSGA
ncbi:hypothetical protein [Microcystis phage Mel-JY01]